MNVNIEDMLCEFNNYADDSKQLLQLMLSLVSEGKVPPKEEVDKLDISIEQLRQKYASIYSAALELVPIEEMPEANEPVSSYAEAIRTSNAFIFKKQMDSIQKILKDFTAVKSLVSNYAAALLPYQKQADEMSKKILDENIPELKNIEQEIAGAKVFLQSLACEDLDSDEGMNLLDQVGEYYPRRIQNGLAAHKYYLPDEIKTVTETDNELLSVQTIENNHVKEVSDEIITEIEIPKFEQDGVSPELGDINNDKEDIETDLGDEPSADSDFLTSVKESGILFAANEKIGQISKDISSSEDKKITASVFLNDVRKGFEKAAKAILKEVYFRNYISSKLIQLLTGMPEAVADGSLDYLQRKGYLRKYKLIPGGEFYCASPKFIKAMTYKDACKLIGVQQRPIDRWGETIEDTETSIAARVIYTKLYYESVKRFIDNDIETFAENTSIYTDAFISKVYSSNDRAECELNISVFWTNTDECNRFWESITKLMAKGDKFKRLIIAGYNLNKAKIFTDIFLGILGQQMVADEIYLYSLSDDKYYAYPNISETSIMHADNMASKDAYIDTLAFKENNEEQEDETSITEEQKRETNAADSSPEILSKKITPKAITMATAKTKSQESSSIPYYRGNANFEDINNIYHMIIDRKFYAATAYVKALSLQNPDFDILYNQLAHALNDPMGHCNYSTDNVFTLITKHGEFEDALVISTAIRTFFSNQVRYDYNIKPFYDGIKEFGLLNNYPALSKVVYMLMEFKDDQKKGLDTYADYRSRSRSELDLEVKKLQQQARIFYDNFVIGRKKENASQKRFLETKKMIFSVSSDIGQYIKAVVDDDSVIQPLVIDFLQENFYKENSTITEETIDSDKLWNYILVYWDKAGDRMMYRRHANLMSHLRSNITNSTMKAVQILARWCKLVSLRNSSTEDEGNIAYKKIRKSLIENLDNSLNKLNISCHKIDISVEEKAGLCILIHTLEEIKGCVDGSFNERMRKYYYIPFLLTDDLMLDENYWPDLDMHSSDMQSLQPTTRILEHIHKLQKLMPQFSDRLNEILEDKGDDYGAARLIVDYLAEQKGLENLSDISENIESGEAYAKETADLRKDDFIGELELAQSYGQIDNSMEDKKEKILQIVDEWYGWAVESSNFGFFKKVMDSYLAELKEEAKSREKDLLEQLDSFKKTTIPSVTAENKEKKIARIQAMIKEQNYTVAEDLLARFSASEEEHEELIEEDFLKEFLDNYDDYYQPVATHKASFANLVNSRTRNKEERGAKKLADNWLPGGSNLGQERLANLLSCFGFKVESIKPQNSIGKFENYFIQTISAKGGHRDNYTHPIAAFGSGAAQDGFRVVCINGGYDADGLIDVMKQIGNAKNTLILLDYALPKSERRRLARKTKNALGDKLFGVVDRTVMMFMVRNYDQTKINRMLISLITPFGYYQPYVWESANVMPPEIFMGRKHELERIKSPTGVNIVYGGRQLGKSALLRKAKEDINWDENGNRAVLVEIKGLDYKQAAQKISHALYDDGIFDTDIDIEDWDKLARAVKCRLQSNTNRIPYLLLLLDEADTFIESCGGTVNYKPFDALKEIQSIGSGRFKFVIAGLRNIVRFKRESLGNNSVLTHLEPMTVKPFNTSEARELLEIPLHYLGLRFPKEKESLITLILATTNYFPGLIQMYCAKLIDAMRNKDYADYNEVDTPIYEVSEDHIKKVLADSEFTQQIREKYIITLKLDEDNYYYLIALIMAFLYHNNGYNDGYSAADIKAAGTDLEIAKIATLDNDKLVSFMEELKELNVLRNTDNTHYLFTRFTFFQMMGTRTEVDDKLEEYMGE